MNLNKSRQQLVDRIVDKVLTLVDTLLDNTLEELKIRKPEVVEEINHYLIDAEEIDDSVS